MPDIGEAHGPASTGAVCIMVCIMYQSLVNQVQTEQYILGYACNLLTTCLISQKIYIHTHSKRAAGVQFSF